MMMMRYALCHAALRRQSSAHARKWQSNCLAGNATVVHDQLSRPPPLAVKVAPSTRRNCLIMMITVMATPALPLGTPLRAKGDPCSTPGVGAAQHRSQQQHTAAKTRAEQVHSGTCTSLPLPMVQQLPTCKLCCCSHTRRKNNPHRLNTQMRQRCARRLSPHSLSITTSCETSTKLQKDPGANSILSQFQQRVAKTVVSCLLGRKQAHPGKVAA
jgi:hypothetical protein